ncbi:PASTA domain-containing protein [Nitriliruptoraceae bacterium ZYF776]|nr:PASTA domain-containing protein [Profundirhabdus halotolerans]
MTTAAAPGRAGALTARLILLVAVITGTGLLLGILVLPTALAANDLLKAVERDVLDVPPIGDIDAPPQNSYVYAADGSELAELNFEENRVPVTLDEIPMEVRHAVLATEDADFYTHQGVNHLAIVRATLTNVRSGGIESGASTITQQYVKQALLTPEQTLARKIQEAVYAIEIERLYSKDEILERYLNRTYFGSGVYGIGTAAERYFSKSLDELSLGEAAALAGTIRSPERNNPIVSLDNAQARRDVVLRQMANAGFISRAQADAAAAEDLEVAVSEPPAPDYPYWVEWVSRLLTNEQVAQALGSQTDALDAMGATFEERRQRVFQAGLRIHTTLDPELQEFAEGALRDRLTYDDEPADEVAREPTGAIVSVEPETGAIVTMAVGPRDYGSCLEDGSWVGEGPRGELLCDRTKVNPAVPTGNAGEGRQPGSAYKPFLIAAALEDGVSPALTMDATGPQRIEGCPGSSGGLWEVNNSGGNGVLDMYEAVARSSNVYMGHLVADIGPEKLAEMGGRLTGHVVPDRDVFCPLSLGATEITPLEIASGYATLANRGTRCEPFAITRIESADGDVLWEHQPDCEQVLDTEIADRVVDMMAGPVSAGGTAPVANLGAWPTRGKTGTTSSYVDAWFVGYVKQLATAAWVGYDNGTLYFETEQAARDVCGGGDEAVAPVSDVWYCPEPSARTLENVTIAGTYQPRVFGGTIPAPMWADFMRQAVQRFSPEGFPNPGPLPSARVPNLLQAGSISEAESIAREAGFRFRVEEVEDAAPQGTFVGQNPSAGSRAPLGSSITLQVSNGEGTETDGTVPDVVGMRLERATRILTEAGYGVSRVDVEVDDPGQVGRVLAQSPTGGSVLAAFEDGVSIVVLEVGVEPADGAPVEPEEPEPGEPGDPPPSGGVTPPPGGGGGGPGGDNGGGPGGGGGGGGGGSDPDPDPTDPPPDDGD